MESPGFSSGDVDIRSGPCLGDRRYQTETRWAFPSPKFPIEPSRWTQLPGFRFLPRFPLGSQSITGRFHQDHKAAPPTDDSEIPAATHDETVPASMT